MAVDCPYKQPRVSQRDDWTIEKIRLFTGSNVDMREVWRMRWIEYGGREMTCLFGTYPSYSMQEATRYGC